MNVSLKKATDFKCPVCRHTMKYELPSCRPENAADSKVQSFRCPGCKCRWTAWDLKVTGLRSAYDKLYSERAKYFAKNKP